MSANKPPSTDLPAMAALFTDAVEYSTDAWQRTILFWDVLRQRSADYQDSMHRTAPNVLRYEGEVLMDGRTLPRPVNYGLVKITPPEGVKIDPKRRPFVVIDPRAGQAPGIGGFKAESEIGVAMNAGHQCYFIGFLPNPEPGQTIEDVMHAEGAFLEKVNELHADADGKPCVIGNCQAGWAVMMLAATRPELFGPIIVAGAPLSYWAGVHGKNPMRYSGGLLGGSWLTALTGDIGNGKFDGAWLVANFEGLNLANTYWDKQYNVWSKVDTEAQRYLEFERWWGNHIMLNAEEMQYIADNLFVGNRLATAEMITQAGERIDLRNITSPILCFCSKGDNITPPQQALGWILDLYRDVDDIRAHGQTIIYALHEDIGHLGIFVSGKVGSKEHAEFSHHIDGIDAMPPGLYEAKLIQRSADDTAAPQYGEWFVRFEMRTLDDIRSLGTNDLEDEHRFAAVRRMSEITNSIYKTYAQPFVRMVANEHTADLLAKTNPVRLPFELFQPENPLMQTVASMAEAVRKDRKPASADNPFVRMQEQVSKQISQTLDQMGQARDSMVENMFLNMFGSPMLQAALGMTSGQTPPRPRPGLAPEEQAFIQKRMNELKARITQGGMREAVTRALLYVAAAHGADERNFATLQHIRAEHGHDLKIGAFKAMMREQALILSINREEALNAIPAMLDGDKTAADRATVMKAIYAISNATGEPDEETRARLDRLEALILPAGSEKKPAARKKAAK